MNKSTPKDDLAAQQLEQTWYADHAHINIGKLQNVVILQGMTPKSQ